MGEDGNIIFYNINNSQQNEESKIIFRDEILVKEILLKEQVILFLNDKNKQIFHFRIFN
jgi:hypothetical protein